MTNDTTKVREALNEMPLHTDPNPDFQTWARSNQYVLRKVLEKAASDDAGQTPADKAGKIMSEILFLKSIEKHTGGETSFVVSERIKALSKQYVAADQTGWKRVPLTATDIQRAAAFDAMEAYGPNDIVPVAAIYAAMVEAAPEQPHQIEREE